MGPSSAAIALRESFGDRRPPDISRKITACVACRKLKIKCHMNDSKPPCSRCNTRKLPCTVNKSIQMLLESDLDWKEAMEKRIGRIEKSITSSASTGSCMDRHDHSSPQMLQNTNGGRISTESSTSSAHKLSETSQEPGLNLSCSLGAFPASSMDGPVLNDKDNSSSGGIDLASRGLVSQQTLEKHFDYYCENLDHFIHRILPAGDTLASVQRRSSLLLAAICTTAAFCAGSDDYQTCFDAFIGEVTAKMFSSTHTFDDVRALCIGAFWLGKISSALNALAVRIAGELNLHRCITKMPHTKKICYDRTRLHFLVYICDHHCSLSHGRPPMTREIKALKSPRALLDSKFSTAADLDLISQVELWSISTQVFDSFGAATDRTFVHGKLAELEHFSDAYEAWRREWLEVLGTRLNLNQTSKAVLDMYFHSARLYLSSHVFRGPAQDHSQPHSTPKPMEGIASCAVQSALSIVQGMSELSERRACPNLPFYFCTVTAFASVFLLKGPWHMSERDRALQCLHCLTSLLLDPLAFIHHTHPLSSIAKSLIPAIGRRYPPEETNGGYERDDSTYDDVNRGNMADGASVSNVLESGQDWLMLPHDLGLDFPGVGDLDFSCTEW